MIAWARWRKRRERQRMVAVLGVFLANPSRKFYALDLTLLAGVPASSIYRVLDTLEQLEILVSYWEPTLGTAPEGHRRRRVYALLVGSHKRACQLISGGVE